LYLNNAVTFSDINFFLAGTLRKCSAYNTAAKACQDFKVFHFQGRLEASGVILIEHHKCEFDEGGAYHSLASCEVESNNEKQLVCWQLKTGRKCDFHGQ